jgi:hypothetical protein
VQFCHGIYFRRLKRVLVSAALKSANHPTVLLLGLYRPLCEIYQDGGPNLPANISASSSSDCQLPPFSWWPN